MERGGTRYYYVQDAIGSVTALTDGAGVSVNTYQYDSFGRIAARTGSVVNPFVYTGREFDSESGLYYYRARYYEAETGRFLQADDARLHSSYAYVDNRPLTFVDPSGNVPALLLLCGGGALIDGGITAISNVAGGRSWYCGVGGAALRGCATSLAFNGLMRGAGLLWRTIAARFSGAGASGGTNVVYQSISGSGTVQYVGITNNFARRAAEHSGRFAVEPIEGLTRLSRVDARAVEQALIEAHGLAKNGGTLLNRINSIARTNPAYAESLSRGRDLLRLVGYPGF